MADRVDGADRVDEYTAPIDPAIHTAHLQQGRPYVVRGGADTWPARGPGGWASKPDRAAVAAALVELVGGETRVVVRDLSGGSTGWLGADSKTSFGDYIEHAWLPGDPNVYLASLAASKLGAITDTFEAPPGPAAQGKPGNLWLGSAGTVTPLHYDFSTREPGMDGLHAVLVGSKSFRLADPVANLGIVPRRSGWWRWHHSSIPGWPDPAHPDTPDAFSYVDVTLGPGDILFIPKLWWHAVRTNAASAAVNYWFQDLASERLKLTTLRPVIDEHLAAAAAMSVDDPSRLANIIAFYSRAAPPDPVALADYIAHPVKILQLDAFLDIFGAVALARALPDDPAEIQAVGAALRTAAAATVTKLASPTSSTKLAPPSSSTPPTSSTPLSLCHD